MRKKEIKTVDEYIDGFNPELRKKLSTIRKIIKSLAPNATESISYGMPAYKTYKKTLVYFGGFKNHIGFYAIPSGHKKFELQLSEYKHGKGSVQFPHDKKLPVELIEQIVKFRADENKHVTG